MRPGVLLLVVLGLLPASPVRSQGDPGDPGSSCPSIFPTPTEGFRADIVPMGLVLPEGWRLRKGCAKHFDVRGWHPGDVPYATALSMPPCFIGSCFGHSGTSNDALHCFTTYGYCCPLEPDQVLVVDTRRMSPITQALADRFFADRDRRPGICFRQYRGDGRRLVRMPILTVPPEPGLSVATVLDYVTLFLRDAPGADAISFTIDVELVDRPERWPKRVGPPPIAEAPPEEGVRDDLPAVVADEDGATTESPEGLRVAGGPRGDRTIRFALRHPARVRLTVHDVAGRRAASLADGPMGAGEHAIAWPARGLGHGIYFVRLETRDGRGELARHAKVVVTH